MIEMVGGEVVTLYLFVKINDYSCIMQHMWLEIRKKQNWSVQNLSRDAAVAADNHINLGLVTMSI